MLTYIQDMKPYSVCCKNNILCQTLKNNLKEIKTHFERINVSLLCLAFINEM